MKDYQGDQNSDEHSTTSDSESTNKKDEDAHKVKQGEVFIDFIKPLAEG